MSGGGSTLEKRGRRRVRALMAAGLACAAVAAYANSFWGVFLFDDEGEIVSNERIRAVDIGRLLARGSSRPLVDLSLQINYALGELRPAGYHAVNLVVHVLAGLTLFGLVRRLAETRVSRARAGGFAFATALVWLVHPLNTQAVTYVIQRSESMMGLFYLLTLYCFVRGMQRCDEATGADGLCGDGARAGWLVASVASCALGMASKAVMVSAPFAVALCDYVFIRGRGVRLRVVYYAALCGTWLLLVWLGVTGSVLGTKADPLSTVGLSFDQIGPWEYLRTQAGVILHYLRLMVWPSPLCLDYDWPPARRFVEYGPQGAVVLMLLGGSVWGTARKQAAGYAGLMFFVALAPTSSIVPVKDVIFEHRMYLPLAAGICVIMCLAAALLDRFRLNRLGPPGVALAGLALAVCTIARNRDYSSAGRMWADVLSTRPDHARALNNLGHVLALEGRDDEAIAHFRRAIGSRPKFAAAHYNLANQLYHDGRIDEAMALFREARRLAPHEIESAIMLANVLSDGQKYSEAIAELRGGIEQAAAGTSSELLARAYFNLGNTLARAARVEEAEASYRRCISIDPGHAKAHYGLGWTLEVRGQLEQAMAEYRRSLELDPGNVQAQEALDALISSSRDATLQP